MPKDWEDDPFKLNSVYESGVEVQDAMQQVEDNFKCLVSSFSGASDPESSVCAWEAFMLWGDTGRNILRRLDVNAYEWLAILSADADQKIWFYRNDTCDGWLIDSSITDRVLAIKGGSQAYNVNGGNVAGDWQTDDHTLTTSEIPSHTHTIGNAGYHTHGSNLPSQGGVYTNITGDSGSSHSHTIGSTGGGGAHNHGDTHRPAATVGTLQYLDI